MQITNTSIDISFLPEVLKKELISYYNNLLQNYNNYKRNIHKQKIEVKNRFTSFFNESNQIHHLKTFSRETLHER